MSDQVSVGQQQAKFRRLTLGLSILVTLLWAAYAILGLLEALPGYHGYGALAAGVVTTIYVIFGLPALLLAWFNRLIGVAFALAVLGLVCYLYDPILRAASLFGL